MRVFAKVVESGSFTGAAARLGISASMVSQHVKELEERLGARLLNRTTRKVSLTETGRAYYERCTRLLADLEETARWALERGPRVAEKNASVSIGQHRAAAPVGRDPAERYVVRGGSNPQPSI